jgi:hypothetical protein
MVKGTSHMALGGPPLVKAVVGEDITAEDLAVRRSTRKSPGVADLEVEDDEHCLRVIKEYLAYFPAHNGEPPPVIACDDPVDRRDEELLTIVPDSSRRAYDVRTVIRAHRRSRGDARDQARMGEEHRRPRWRVWAVTRSGWWPTSRWCSAARWTSTAPTRPARFIHAVRRVRHPAGVPAGRPRLHGGLQGRARRHHSPRRQDALCGERKPRCRSSRS